MKHSMGVPYKKLSSVSFVKINAVKDTTYLKGVTDLTPVFSTFFI
jgi:hypothetical protein